MEAAATELNGWRETIENLGIGALIVVCITALLWKAGGFLGPLLAKTFERLFEALGSVTKLNTSVESLVNRIGDGFEHSQRQSSALEAAVEFAGELAVSGKLSEERAKHHVERVKERLRG